MNHYETLGISENASQDDIKKAYKKLAMKHHPDRGGDTKYFQSLSEAYETLSDPQKRQEYDMTRNGSPFINVNTGNMHDIFGFHMNDMFGHFFRHEVRQKNRDLNIQCTITFKQSFTGTQLEANYKLPSGKDQHLTIDIPPGISNGQAIRYARYGDDSFPHLPRGDLNVTVLVTPDEKFERKGDDIITQIKISPFEAMTGCVKEVVSVTDEISSITINPGTQSNSHYVKRGLGFRNLHNKQLGNFIVVVEVEIPAITDPILKNKVQELHAEISKKSR